MVLYSWHWLISTIGHTRFIAYKGRVCQVGACSTQRLHQWKEGHALFNDALNTFYLRLYGVRHMVKDHWESKRGNPPPPPGLLLMISSKGSFICIIPTDKLTNSRMSLWIMSYIWRKEGHALFNDALNTFYLRLYGVRHMVKDHWESEKGNPLPPHGLHISY